jgi:ankyrin repeat protein
LPTFENKKKLLIALVGAGLELNQQVTQEKHGNFGGYRSKKYPIFDLVKKVEQEGDDSEALVKFYLECGVDVNCEESFWKRSFDDDEESADTKEAMTLLHVAIDTGVVSLVDLLIEKGSDVNQNMVFTEGGHYYLMSCLELAIENGNQHMISTLLSAGAREAIEQKKGKGHFYRSGNWDRDKISYGQGGKGKWRSAKAKRSETQTKKNKTKCTKKVKQ